MAGLNQEVTDLNTKMKIVPGAPDVRRRYNNASLAMKVKYKRAVWNNVFGNLRHVI